MNDTKTFKVATAPLYFTITHVFGGRTKKKKKKKKEEKTKRKNEKKKKKKKRRKGQLGSVA